MKTIPLTQGKFAIVDDEDFGRASKFKWYAHWTGRGWYAETSPNGKAIFLHRFILQPSHKEQIDHRDGNGLNCQRNNLRLATHSQNMANRKIQSNNTSGYVGVRCVGNRWCYAVGKRGQWHYGFRTATEAARARDREAKLVYRDFARLNY